VRPPARYNFFKGGFGVAAVVRHFKK
jgi:hypothetical protein